MQLAHEPVPPAVRARRGVRRLFPAVALGIAAALSWMAFLPAAGAAPPDGPRNLKEMAREADLVFRGVVTGIEYVLSEPCGPNQVRLPYTFVTYDVSDVLAGDAPGRTVTLRFMGGLDERTMLYMETSQAPQFDLGDEDILFVAGNNRRICPLVRGREGRMRLIGGRTYSETGREVLLDGDDTVRFGKRHRFEEVETTHVAGKPMRTFDDPEAEAASSDSLGGEVVEVVLDRIARGASGSARARGFENADPGRPFPGPDVRPMAPPAEQAGGPPARRGKSGEASAQDDVPPEDVPPGRSGRPAKRP